MCVFCLHRIQQEAIAKAVNNVESAVKEKHIRNILLHIYDNVIKIVQQRNQPSHIISCGFPF